MYGIVDSRLTGHFVYNQNAIDYPMRFIDYKEFCKKSRPEFNVGDIAYWVEGNFQDGWDVKFGIIDQILQSCYIANYLVMRHILKIQLDGKEYTIETQAELADFFADKSWRKLPKGWKPGDVPFSYEFVPVDFKDGILTTNADDLKNALERGELVSEKDSICHTYKIDLKVEDGRWRPALKMKGWRNDGKILATNFSLCKEMVFHEYADAWTLAQKIREEQSFISDMDDREFAIFEITDCLDRACHSYISASITELEAKKIHNFMMKLKNLDRVECRFVTEGFQWRYFDERKWHTVNPDNLFDDGGKR